MSDRQAWIALLTAPPGDHGDLSEPWVCGGYARAAASMGWFPLHRGYALRNVRPVLFPQATTDWGVIVAFAVCWSPDGCEFDSWGRLADNYTPFVQAGGWATFGMGEIEVMASF
jgi:hypothetical protein